jgi:hypothetical protein
MVLKPYRRLRKTVTAVGFVWLALIVVDFPYATGAYDVLTERAANGTALYARAYEGNSEFAQNAANAVASLHVREQLRDFIVQHDLKARKHWKWERARGCCKT